MLEIRYAQSDDLPLVLEYYLAALAELKDVVLKPNPDKCALEVIESWQSAPCVLLHDGADVFGFAGLRCVTPVYSDERIIEEYMFYIRPDKRSVKAARALSEAVKNVANDAGLVLFMRHGVGDSELASKEKFLKRWGYQPLGIYVRYQGGKK